jgi:pilus assembly protein CpaF
MSLSARLKQVGENDVAESSEPLAGGSEIYQRVKAELHTKLIDGLDLNALSRLQPELLKQEIANLLASAVAEGDLPLNRRERTQMVQDLVDEITGLGPLEPLLRDPSISDILVNTYANTYIERGGRLEPADARFRNNDHLQQTIRLIVCCR